MNTFDHTAQLVTKAVASVYLTAVRDEPAQNSQKICDK